MFRTRQCLSKTPHFESGLQNQSGICLKSNILQTNPCTRHNCVLLNECDLSCVLKGSIRLIRCLCQSRMVSCARKALSVTDRAFAEHLLRCQLQSKLFNIASLTVVDAA